VQSVLVAPPGTQGRVPVVPVPVEEPLCVPVPLEEPLVLLVPVPSLDPVPASERRIVPLELEPESLPDMWAQPDTAKPSATASASQLSFFIGESP
jgi:hypothetical protein